MRAAQSMFGGRLDPGGGKGAGKRGRSRAEGTIS